MSPQRNIVRGVLTTIGPFMVGCLVVGAGPGEPTMPDPGDVVEAYATLRGWVDAFDLPQPDEPEASVRLRGASGVCVILRRRGRVLGTGVDAGGSELAVRRAAGRALGAVLADPVVSNLPPELREQVGRSLTLELEIAGTPLPILGRTFKEIADQLAPGLDGVAIRRGSRWAMLFPAQLRARNMAGRVERLLRPLATKLGLAPMSLPQLTSLHDISMYRFRSTHLAQTLPDRLPFETFRGDRIVAEKEVDAQSIAALADGIANHLIVSESPLRDPVGVMGTYRPVADRYDPLIAPPLEQALVAFALARFGRTPGVDAQISTRAAEAGHRILHQLRRVAPSEEDPLASAVVAAAIVHAGIEVQKLDADCNWLVSKAASRVVEAFTVNEGFVEADGAKTITAHGNAMIAAALSLLLKTETPGLAPATVRAAIDTAWDSVPEHKRVTLLPWLGWAESDFAEASARPLARIETLKRLREFLDASRIGTPARPGPPDLAGGFALTAGNRFIADAQTLRPAAYLATMVRDRRLTPPAEAQLALGRHLKTIRFLIQLAVRKPSVWALKNPARALGGVRASPWDADQPVAAQALGLLTAAETLMSLDAMARGNPQQDQRSLGSL